MGQSHFSRQGLVPGWMRQVEPGQLPEVYQEIVGVIGLEPTLQLAQVFSGNSVYFPKLDRALIELRNRLIRSEFDGANTRALARRWGLSSRHVRHILRPMRREEVN